MPNKRVTVLFFAITAAAFAAACSRECPRISGSVLIEPWGNYYTLNESDVRSYVRAEDAADACYDFLSWSEYRYDIHYDCEIVYTALSRFLISHVSYEHDDWKGKWQRANETYARGKGDCEDYAILAAAMLLYLGCPHDMFICFGVNRSDGSKHHWLSVRFVSDISDTYGFDLDPSLTAVRSFPTSTSTDGEPLYGMAFSYYVVQAVPLATNPRLFNDAFDPFSESNDFAEPAEQWPEATTPVVVPDIGDAASGSP